MGERKIMCTIDINDMIDIKAADYIIRNIKIIASNEPWELPDLLRSYEWYNSDIVSVKFMVSPFEMENYCDFSVDNEGNGHASVYASKRNIKETDRIKKELADINSGDTFKKICESFACANATKVEASDMNNKKDFEYICDRCGVRVKTPNTLRGPVNVVDFYREVEDEVGDSVSYKLCRDCMQDFFGFLSYN